MTVLFDTNVVLDVLLGRPPWATTSSNAMAAVENGAVVGLLCATTVTTIDYLAGKRLGRPAARAAVGALLELFDVAAVDRGVLTRAYRSPIEDFEDAVLQEAAVARGATAIVTRNVADFQRAELEILTPAGFRAWLVHRS